MKAATKQGHGNAWKKAAGPVLEGPPPIKGSSTLIRQMEEMAE